MQHKSTHARALSARVSGVARLAGTTREGALDLPQYTVVLEGAVARVTAMAAAIATEGLAVRWLTRAMPTGRVWGG